MIEDIGAYLEKCGVGKLGKYLFLSLMPDKPAECMTLYEYQGQLPEQMAGMETPGLQITVRTARYKDGNAKLQQAHNALKEIGFEDGQCPEGVEINGSFYFRIIPTMSGVMPLGEDDNGRFKIVRNYYVVKEEEK